MKWAKNGITTKSHNPAIFCERIIPSHIPVAVCFDKLNCHYFNQTATMNGILMLVLYVSGKVIEKLFIFIASHTHVSRKSNLTYFIQSRGKVHVQCIQRYDRMDHQRMNLIEKLFTFYELNINFENDRMTYIPK